MTRRHRHALSLLELILVLAVIVLLAFMFFPSAGAMLDAHKATGGVDATRTAWVLAQARASEEGRPYRFGVIPGTGNFCIAPDSEGFWSGSGVIPIEDPTLPPLVMEDALPAGAVFVVIPPEQYVNQGDLTILTMLEEMSLGVPPGNDTFLPAGTISPTQYVPVAVFLPDGTARDDAVVGVKVAGVPVHGIRLRAMTGVITVLRRNQEN